MKSKFNFLIIFLFAFFFSCFSVNAQAIESYVDDGWVKYNSSYYRWGSMSQPSNVLLMNQELHAHAGSFEPIYIGMDADYIVHDYIASGGSIPNLIYVRQSFCSTGSMSGGYNAEQTSNIVFIGYNNIKCSVYGGKSGFLIQATYSVNVRPISAVRYNLSHWVGTNVSADTYFSLLGIDFSPTPFNRFNEYDTTNEYLYNIMTKFNSGISVSDGKVQQKLDDVNNNLRQTNTALNKTNETLNDDDTTESTDTASSFFSGFSTDTHGLTGIITAPITLIGNITSSSCSSLQVPLPFVNKNLSLPCMSSIYSQYFGNFYNIYKIITFGIVSYWVCVRIFNLVKDFKNPDHDEIEVMDL